MTPLYWIDGTLEYDREMFQKGIAKSSALLAPIAEIYGVKMTFINIADLFFGYGDKPHVYFQGKDLLEQEAFVHIPYTNPHPQTERLLHSLARIVQSSPQWTEINIPSRLDCDKENAYQLAALIGAKTPPTWIVPHRTTSRMQVNLIEKQVGPYPYIIKPTSMLAGIGVMKIDNRDALCSLLDYCAQSPHTYLIQPFIKEVIDYRVYIENHQVVACQMRFPPDEGYLANISQRGTGKATLPPPLIESLSTQLAKYLTDGYLCIDWLVTPEEIYLSEIESCGLFFGLPEPERNHVIHAFFRSVVKRKKSK